MTVKYIVNETGNPIEVLIPYKEFQLLQPLFSLLTEDEVTPNSIQETDHFFFFNSSQPKENTNSFSLADDSRR
jgi:hypothetical protein